MRIIIVIAAVLAAMFAACSSDSGSITDADPAAPVCTGMVYDNCTSNAQCTSGMCHLFEGDFQVCTQTCTPGDNSTCPSTNTEKCNNRGICKPTTNDSGSGGCRPPS